MCKGKKNLWVNILRDLSVSCNLQWNCRWPWKCARGQGTPGSYLVRWPCSRIQKSFIPFLDLTWSNRTLRSNLDRLATWERDADVKAKVRVAAATFNTKKQDNRWSKRESKCKYCGKLGHWEKECGKLQDSKRNAMHNSAPSQPAHNPEVVPPVTTETVGQLVQALLRAQQDQEKN